MIALATKRDFKDRLYAESARIGEAISNAHRLGIPDVRTQGENSPTTRRTAGARNCVYADEAASVHAHGRQAQWLTRSFPERRRDGR